MLDGKKWEWDLSFRWEWEWDGNGNEVTEMGGNWYEKSIPAHLYSTVTDQRRKNFFVRKSSFVIEVPPNRCVLLIGDDFG